VMCENRFEVTDMAHCPVYAAPICSLCCTLETNCHDRCKADSRATQQLSRWIEYLLPRRLARYVHTPVGHFIQLMVAVTVAIGAVTGALAWQINGLGPELAAQANSVLFSQFLLLFLLGGILSWILVLVH